MRRQLVGIVTRDKNPMTRRVEVARTYRHPKYGKIVRDRTICYMHDAKNETKIGDLVEIGECRPMSRTKCWELVRIVKSGSGIREVNVDGTVVEPTKTL